MATLDSPTLAANMLGERWKTWWTRPAGMQEVLRISLPLVVSTSSWTIMNFIDRVLLMRYSADAMAASVPGSMAIFTATCFFLGVASYVNTFVAQYHGAGHDERIGLAVWQANFVALLVGPLMLLTSPLVAWAWSSAGHDPEVARLEALYYQINIYGAPATVLASSLSSFFTGRGHVARVMVVDFLGAALNVVLDLLWIFGLAGFPAWGVAGAAWATVVALWFRAIVYLVMFLAPRERERYQTWNGFRFDPQLFGRLFRFGSPSGLQLLIEAGSFTILLVLIGRLGKLEQTASNLAFNLNGLVFMPILGFGLATSTLVGQKLGKEQPDLAARATWSSFWLSSVYTLALAVIYVLLPDMLLASYGVVAEGELEEIHDLAVVLLRFVAAYCFVDSVNFIFASAIKGAGDTLFVLVTTCVTSGAALVASYVGLVLLGYGVYFAWILLTVWIFALGFAYLARFLQGKWRSMRVIEREYLLHEVESGVGETGSGVRASGTGAEEV